MKAAVTCPTCGYPESNPELVTDENGYTIGVMLECVACGGFHSIWHGASH